MDGWMDGCWGSGIGGLWNGIPGEGVVRGGDGTGRDGGTGRDETAG